MDRVEGLGRAIFAAVFLMIGGILNMIFGIAAIGNSHFFTHKRHHVFADLKTWGWARLRRLRGTGEISCSVPDPVLAADGADRRRHRVDLGPPPRGVHGLVARRPGGSSASTRESTSTDCAPRWRL